MPIFEESQIDFEVWCSCGTGLCENSIANEKNDYREITVVPCENCMSRASTIASDVRNCIVQFLLSGEEISEKWRVRFNAVLNELNGR